MARTEMRVKGLGSSLSLLPFLLMILSESCKPSGFPCLHLERRSLNGICSANLTTPNLQESMKSLLIFLFIEWRFESRVWGLHLRTTTLHYIVSCAVLHVSHWRERKRSKYGSERASEGKIDLVRGESMGKDYPLHNT